jgi:hypothetical protein
MVCTLAVAGCQSRPDDRAAEQQAADEPSGISTQGDDGLRVKAAAPPKFAFDKNEPAFLAEVEAAIPIGTSIEDAERILKANGFKCKRRDGSDGKPGLTARHSKPLGFLVSWVWVVWLTEEDGKVSGVTGSTAGLGP